MTTHIPPYRAGIRGTGMRLLHPLMHVRLAHRSG